MSLTPKLAVSLVIALCTGTASLTAAAQQNPRSFIYRILAQIEQFKIISVVWKPGQKDVLHSHPANGVYYLTDCSLRMHAPDGTTREVQPKAGFAVVQSAIPGHVLENIGTSDCRLVMFEPA